MHAAVPFRIWIIAKSFDRDLTHARHDPHIKHNIFRIGNLEADFRQRRIRRAHDVGNDKQRASSHRAFQKAAKFGVRFSRLRPIVGGTGLFLRRRTDERELLDSCDVVWIGAMQMRTRNFLLIEPDQKILFKRFTDQELAFPIRAIAPENVFRFCQVGDFIHPIENRLIGRPCITDSTGREYGWRDIFHKRRMCILAMNRRLGHVESLKPARRFPTTINES